MLDSKNGDVTASHKSAAKGTTVTLTSIPTRLCAGYPHRSGRQGQGDQADREERQVHLHHARQQGHRGGHVQGFCPTGKNPFIDVPSGSYYEDAVVWAVEKGITSGTSAVTFDPSGNCTRAQAVTFLWRAAGSPAPKTKVMPFTDVPSGSYYYDAVLWAMEQALPRHKRHRFQPQHFLHPRSDRDVPVSRLSGQVNQLKKAAVLMNRCFLRRIDKRSRPRYTMNQSKAAVKCRRV